MVRAIAALTVRRPFGGKSAGETGRWVGLLAGPRRLGRFMTLLAHKWSQADFPGMVQEGTSCTAGCGGSLVFVFRVKDFYRPRGPAAEAGCLAADDVKV